MKILTEKYPMGSIPGQRAEGRTIDKALYSNISFLADKIVDDMTFLVPIFSSTLEVGTGKSTLATQIGEAYTSLVNEKHGLNLTFDMKNVVFNPKKFIETAYKLPKYSCILLDEWESANYWSDIALVLRTFFQKCRQLNLFMMIIIPNFFRLPIDYALSRSIFAIDVKFEDGLERGHFGFYSFYKKNELRIKGARDHNYKVVAPDFLGTFSQGYGVDEVEYRKAKLQDMLDSEKEKAQPYDMKVVIRDTKFQLYKRMMQKYPKIPEKDAAEVVGVDRSTILEWKKNETERNKPPVEYDGGIVGGYTSNQITKTTEILEEIPAT